MSSIIRADTIQDLSGNNIINESGNTITIGASGDTTNIIGTLQNNGASVGGANTPAFFATVGYAQSISDATYTKLNFDTVVFNSGEFISGGSHKFTPAVVGKYLISLQVAMDEIDDQKRIEARIYKNGSAVSRAATVASVSGGSSFPHTSTNGFIIDFDADDYIEGYVYHNHGSSRNIRASSETYFGAYKLIGV